jgi:hypothetical protein
LERDAGVEGTTGRGGEKRTLILLALCAFRPERREERGPKKREGGREGGREGMEHEFQSTSPRAARPVELLQKVFYRMYSLRVD